MSRAAASLAEDSPSTRHLRATVAARAAMTGNPAEDRTEPRYRRPQAACPAGRSLPAHLVAMVSAPRAAGFAGQINTTGHRVVPSHGGPTPGSPPLASAPLPSALRPARDRSPPDSSPSTTPDDASSHPLDVRR